MQKRDKEVCQHTAQQQIHNSRTRAWVQFQGIHRAPKAPTGIHPTFLGRGAPLCSRWPRAIAYLAEEGEEEEEFTEVHGQPMFTYPVMQQHGGAQGTKALMPHTQPTDFGCACVRVGGGRAAIGSNVSSVRRLRSAELSEESSLASRGGGGEGGSLQARPGPQAPPGPPRRPQASRSGQGRGATAAPGSRPRSGPGAARGRRKSPAAPPRRLRVLGRPRPRREPPARLPSLPSPRRPRPRSGGRPRSPGTQTMSGPNSPVAPGLRGSGGGSPAPSPFSPPPPRSDIRTRREQSPLLPSPPREPPAAPPPRAKSLYSPLQHGCFPRRRLSAAPQRNAAAGRAGSRTLPVPSAEPRVSRSGPSAARGRAEPGYASPLRAAASARSQRTEPAPPAARAQEGPRGRPDAGDT